jgi:biotin transport system substrate-specific component
MMFPRLTLSDLARIATFAAIIAVLGLPGTIPVAGGAVPITLQTLGVMLAGTILGWRRAAIAILVVLLLVATGLPLLSGGRGGFGVFLGPSAGYLIGWVFGAAVIGLIARSPKSARPSWLRVGLGSVVGGIVVVYAVGIPVQSLVTGVPLGATALLSLVFVPGDLIKVVLATLLTVAVWRSYPRAFDAGQSDRSPRVVSSSITTELAGE